MNMLAKIFSLLATSNIVNYYSAWQQATRTAVVALDYLIDDIAMNPMLPILLWSLQNVKR